MGWYEQFCVAALKHMHITATGAPLGAIVTDIDLTHAPSASTVASLRQAWIEHGLLIFPDQPLEHAQLANFSQAFGPFGEDRYIAAIAQHPHVIEVRRNADEKTTVFASKWHSDWSFLETPPAGTMLHAKVVPPHGGDTLFCDNAAAYEGLSEQLKTRIATLKATHSPAGGYSRKGRYGEDDAGRSMDIRPSDQALSDVYSHPIVKPHSESGRPVLYVSPAYTVRIGDLAETQSQELLSELYAHQGQQEFVYRHQWQTNMLVLWDNRRVNHMATGGYEGYDRVLHRTTIADAPSAGLSA